MRYFSYIAEQSFRTDETGRRLFFMGGPFSRPYVIPDAETEIRIMARHIWLVRLTVGPLVLAVLLMPSYCPAYVRDPIYFLGFMVVGCAVSYTCWRLTHRNELSRLVRLPNRLPQHSFWLSVARRRSVSELALALVGCLVFVAVAWILPDRDTSPVISGVVGAFFVLGALGWGDALLLKLRESGRPST